MTKRRTKGDGGLTQRADGRWQGTLRIEQPDGRTRTKYVYGRTKADAKRKLDALRRAKDSGALVAATTPTLTAYLETWLERRRLPPKPLKASTWNGYESKIRVHIVPTLGRRRLDQLRGAHIEALYDAMRASGASEATVRQTHAILSKALSDALRKGLLGVSPMQHVDPPGTETDEREQFTGEQAVQVIRAAGDSARWWLALFYAMRQGEVLGLDWRHVDFETHTMSVAETLTEDYGDRRKTQKGTPKSVASRRVLPMLPQIEVRLRLLWEEQGRPDAGLVFPSASGGPMDPKRDWLDWRELIDRAAVVPFAPLPYIALHAARNSAASLMEALGVPDRVAQQILGHSTLRMTHRYQRADIERLRAELSRVEQAVMGRVPRQLHTPDA